MRCKNLKQKKHIKSISKKLIPLMIIFVLIFYPFLFSLSVVQAQEETVITTDTDQDSESKTSKEETKSDDDTKQEDEKDTEEKISTQTDAKKETTKDEQDPKTETTTATEEKAADKVEPSVENKVEVAQTATASETKTENIDNQNLPTPDETATEADLSMPKEAANDSPNVQQDQLNTCCEDSDAQINDTVESKQANTCCTDADNSTECCPEAAVKNNNNAEIVNTADSTVNTGNNAIDASQNLTTESNKENPQSDEDVSVSESNEDTHNTATEHESTQSIETQELADSKIASGDAITDATIVNETNTNIISDNYIDSVINITGDESSDINLLDQFQNLLASAQDLNSENLKSLEITNTNNANITNDVQSTANTGSNAIGATNTVSPTENSQITTGDASANANVVNIVNRNLIGNNWIFTVINVLGDWAGNLIVPGEGLLQTPASQVATNMEIVNENEATVVNNVNANADSGENSITNNPNDALITTGDAVSSANATNILNTNIIQNNWFVLLINNLGSWSGKIVGRDDADSENSNVCEYNFEAANESNLLTSIYSFLSIHNLNQATITNDVDATATTGNNSIKGDADGATIQTGDASASARAVNIVNTNIVGNNWLFAIVNVLGSWHGDAILAYPDLTINLNKEVSEAYSGDTLTYKLSYENLGQADADNVQVKFQLPAQLHYASDNSGAELANDEANYIWTVGTLKAKEKKSFNIVVAANNIDGDAAVAKTKTTVSTSTKETELANNAASDDITIFPQPSTENDKSRDADESDIHSRLRIKRDHLLTTSATTGSFVTNSIYVKNSGNDTLYNIEVTDTIKDPDGNVIGKYTWPLGTLKKSETLLIQYQFLVNYQAKPGDYVYKASGVSYNTLGKKIKSNYALNKLNVLRALVSSGNKNFSNEALDVPIITADEHKTLELPKIGPFVPLANSPAWFLFTFLPFIIGAVRWLKFSKPKITLTE